MSSKRSISKKVRSALFTALCAGLIVSSAHQSASAADSPENETSGSPSVNTFLERFAWGADIVTVIQGSINNSSNWKRMPGYPTRHDTIKLQMVSDIWLETQLWQGATAFARIEAADGSGLSRHTDGLTGTNDNVKDFDEKIAEVWIEQSLFDERLVITLGKLDPAAYFDTNEVANDERSQFLSSQFVNSLAFDSPEYAYGARVSVSPLKWLSLSGGVFEDGRKFANLSSKRFSIAELAVMPEMFGRPGTYRMHVWHNNTNHEKLRNPQKNKESGTGFGISFDQYLTEEVCVFARWGKQSSDIYEAQQVWSLGFQVAGSAWTRPDDVFGLAYGRAVLSNAYRDTLRGDNIRTADEGRFEVYYKFQLNEYISLSPDLQVAHNLTGARKANTVTIFGLRMHIAL
jgi:carbohydrate-selective porin OprB